jgi:hypothetical protein
MEFRKARDRAREASCVACQLRRASIGSSVSEERLAEYLEYLNEDGSISESPQAVASPTTPSVSGVRRRWREVRGACSETKNEGIRGS